MNDPKHALAWRLLGDYGGRIYTLEVEGKVVKEWLIRYGYNTPEWQEQERADTKEMLDYLEAKGLRYLYDNL